MIARIRHFTHGQGLMNRAMRSAGLTQGYDTALQTGNWPSEDVLPKELRRE